MRIISPVIFVFCALSFYAGFKLPLYNDCITTRAAYDIGSGSTRLKVAKINICKREIVKVLFDDRVKVPFKNDLSKSENGQFSDKVFNQGFEAIRKLTNESKKYKAKETYAVATAAFRQSENSSELVEKIKSELKIDIHIIEHKTEAKLGYAGAKRLVDKGTDEFVMWDIGGGSMQIVSFSKTNRFKIYLGKLAAVSFKNVVISKIQNKSVKSTNTPNPMSISDVESALNYAHSFANKNIPADLISEFQRKPQVIGIGGVHFYSIKNQVNTGDTYFYQDVVRTLEKKTGLTDEQLQSDFASTEISNLSLVAGFMRALNIDKIKTGKINLTDGLLIAPELIFRPN